MSDKLLNLKIFQNLWGLGLEPHIAKPLKGFGSGVFEVALAYRGNAYRTVYVLNLGAAIWVVHAFQKKSTKGIKTPQREIEIIRERIKRLKDMFT